MKKSLLPILIFSTCLLIASCGNIKKHPFDCDNKAEKIASMLDEYHFTNDSAYLDSALILINDVMSSCPDRIGSMKLRKAIVLSLKREYPKSIAVIEGMENNDFHFTLSKSIVLNKLKAKEALQNGDTISAHKYFESVSREYDSYMRQHKNEVDSVLMLPHYTDILGSEWGMLVMMYFNSKARTYGYSEANVQLDLLHNATNGNPDFFEYLRNMISGSPNYQMDTFFD